MEVPQSCRCQPWYSFTGLHYNIFSQPFFHENFVTVNASSSQAKGSMNYSLNIFKNGDSLKSGEGLQLWVPAWEKRGGAIFFESNERDYKIHYDDGVHELSEKHKLNYNAYCGLKSNRHLDIFAYKLGVNLIGPNYNVENRIKFQRDIDGVTPILELGNKTNWKGENWELYSYRFINFNTKKFLCNTLLKYSINLSSFYFNAYHSNPVSFSIKQLGNLYNYADQFTLGFVRTINNTHQIGFETYFNPEGFDKATICMQKYFPRRGNLRIKASSSKTIEFSYQKKICVGKIGLGVIKDFDSGEPLKYGIQMHVNINL